MKSQKEFSIEQDAGPTRECARREALIEDTEERLLRMAQLARHQAEALRNGSDNLVMSLDQEIETTLGAKERSLGALRAHREEHGC